MRYNNGKIYRITNNIDDMIYIGSTCLPLRKRFIATKPNSILARDRTDACSCTPRSMAGRSSTST